MDIPKMFLTWVLVIIRVWVLADNQVFSVGLLQQLVTVVGMLIAHLYRVLEVISAERKMKSHFLGVVNNFPLFYQPCVPCVNGNCPDIKLW